MLTHALDTMLVTYMKSLHNFHYMVQRLILPVTKIVQVILN